MICKLYRMIKRTIQAIHLIELLIIADTQWHLPVDWTELESLCAGESEGKTTCKYKYN